MRSTNRVFTHPMHRDKGTRGISEKETSMLGDGERV